VTGAICPAVSSMSFNGRRFRPDNADRDDGEHDDDRDAHDHVTVVSR